jgi:hypothetical protein
MAVRPIEHDLALAQPLAAAVRISGAGRLSSPG